jgi:hypothetical protein
VPCPACPSGLVRFVGRAGRNHIYGQSGPRQLAGETNGRARCATASGAWPMTCATTNKPWISKLPQRRRQKGGRPDQQKKRRNAASFSSGARACRREMECSSAGRELVAHVFRRCFGGGHDSNRRAGGKAVLDDVMSGNRSSKCSISTKISGATLTQDCFLNIEPNLLIKSRSNRRAHRSSPLRNFTQSACQE